MKPRPRPKCLNPACNNRVHSRGLCRLCYLSASRLIRLKRTTWDELIETGKALKHVPRGDHSRAAWLLSPTK